MTASPIDRSLAEEPLTFERSIAVDWSGARGGRQKGIAVAQCVDGEVSLVRNAADWSREAVVEWLEDMLDCHQCLVGFDFSFSLPFIDYGRYLPHAMLPVEAPRDLWQMIEGCCMDEPYLEGHAFVDKYDGYFYRHALPGELFEQYGPRLRATEEQCIRQGLGRAASAFHLIGPQQVGLSSFSGMRALYRLQQHKIWPFDTIMRGDSVLVEMFTRLFLLRAGAGQAKVRRAEDIKTALHNYGAILAEPDEKYDDHQSDALISAAGLSSLAAEGRYWYPPSMNEDMRKTEGWTFGVL